MGAVIIPMGQFQSENEPDENTFGQCGIGYSTNPKRGNLINDYSSALGSEYNSPFEYPHPLANRFFFATGDVPETIVSIGAGTKNWLGGAKMTKVKCGKAHGLKEGDSVYILPTGGTDAATVKKYTGYFTVVRTGDSGLLNVSPIFGPGGVIAKEVSGDDYFIISPEYTKGEVIEATWQKKSAALDAQLAAANTPVVVNPVVTTNPVTGLPEVEEGGVVTTGLSASKTVWYIAGGLAILAIAVFAVRAVRNRG